mmetsp:Transcript_762/g.988  ORF Transcript_762/g.988 Transcript_762/m.988 type:complete len:88 (+) Transcript_762:95-358(+)
MSTDDSKIHYATASEVPAGYGEPVYVTATEVKDENKLSDPLKSSSRFYCHQCRAPYDLPYGATSWRCQNCMTFNNTVEDECPCCTIS